MLHKHQLSGIKFTLVLVVVHEARIHATLTWRQMFCISWCSSNK